jgi:hypothetical protein
MDSTTTPWPAVEGGCLCGRVRYRATPDHRDGYYCHCRMCQLAFGNTRAAYINLRKSEVTWLAPPTFFASSKIARRGFCNQCGTPLSFEFLDSERMDLSAGTLDDPGAFKPTAHYAVESRIASWHASDELNEERLDANERIAQRWRDAYGADVWPGLDAARPLQPSKSLDE